MQAGCTFQGLPFLGESWVLALPGLPLLVSFQLKSQEGTAPGGGVVQGAECRVVGKPRVELGGLGEEGGG